ncbi:unnamed protein product [Calypogeia fissa]
MTTGAGKVATEAGPVTSIKLKPTELTPENFEPYGQIVGPTDDGKDFDSTDAQLDFSHGVPRFYIMHLEDRKSLRFDDITHHARVSQCLGSVGAQSWYLAVAPASIVQTTGETDNSGVNAVRSKAGHNYVPPSPDEVRVFRVDGPHFLKLHVGTWHAGPFFTPDWMDFYNLELSDTNAVDHTRHVFRVEDKVVFEIDDP